MQQRDLKRADIEFDKIFKILKEDKYNSDYIFALLARAKLYIHFELLDRAEFMILKALGLSDDLAKRINSLCVLRSTKETKDVISKLEENIKSENYYGYHVARGFIINMFNLKDDGEFDKLRGEAKGTKYDLVIYPILLRVGVTKYNRNRALKVLKEKLKKAKSIDEVKYLQNKIAIFYHLLGDYKRALEMADTLEKGGDRLNALYIRMNVATSRGEYKSMKKYEEEILKIDPKAF
jgi:tetratricopeptide (TPR) repeat protein